MGLFDFFKRKPAPQPQQPQPTFADYLLHYARAEVGTREEGGDNRGARVGQYLRSVGLGQGNPWCCAFVYFCAQAASNALQMPVPMPKTGLCATVLSWGTSRGKLINPAQARPGDIGIMQFGGGKGHIFIITANRQGYFETIEGNTNEAGSREGDGVYTKTRAWSSVAGVVRLV